MIKMTNAQQLEEKCPGKLAGVAPAHYSITSVGYQQAFRRVIILVLVTLGLFATTVRAQIVGITKPFDPTSQQQAPAPANQQPAPIGDAVVTGNGIEYHGGPVMPGPHNVYLIWYGNWTGNNATTILPDLISGLGGSLYFNTNTTYGDATHDVANTVTLAGQRFDNYSQGTALTLQSLGNSIVGAMNAGAFPVDPNAIYFVLTSPDVTETDFCVKACGFHFHGTVTSTLGTTDIKAAWVGNPATQCPAACSTQSITPNGNRGADAMASVIAHELNEAVTDPDGDAWFHIDGTGEVGDLCNFMYGSTFTALNGANANVVLSGRQYLIQQNWLNAGGGGCAMGFNAQAPAGLTFVPVTPCRVADTRNPVGPFGGPFLAAQSTRGFTIPSSACNIPTSAKAYSVNATVVPKGFLGFLTIFPCGQPLPLASTLNATDGRVKAAAAIVPAGTNGGLCFFTTNDTELVLDINGYFVPNSDVTA